MAQGCELSFCFQHLGLNVAEYNNLIYHDTCADNVHQNIFTKKLKTRCGGGMESGVGLQQWRRIVIILLLCFILDYSFCSICAAIIIWDDEECSECQC